jgi:hypothetical protein
MIIDLLGWAVGALIPSFERSPELLWITSAEIEKGKKQHTHKRLNLLSKVYIFMIFRQFT